MRTRPLASIQHPANCLPAFTDGQSFVDMTLAPNLVNRLARFSLVRSSLLYHGTGGLAIQHMLYELAASTAYIIGAFVAADAMHNTQ